MFETSQQEALSTEIHFQPRLRSQTPLEELTTLPQSVGEGVWRTSRHSHGRLGRGRECLHGTVRQTAVPPLKVVRKPCAFLYHFSGNIRHTCGTFNVNYDNKHQHIH